MEQKPGWIGDPIVKDVRTTKEESETRLEKMQNYIPELTGYGITGVKEDKIAVICEKLTPELKSMFREGIRGKDVEFLEVGKIVPEIDRTLEIRPLLGGISIGHYLIATGTLGSIVYDRDTNEQLILSNNHVIANCDEGNGRATEGDAIYQPGVSDGGRGKTVGYLKRWVPLKTGCTIDAAVASTIVDTSNVIIDIPAIKGTIAPEVGMEIKKSGRTTGLTTGKILAIETSINIFYRSDSITLYNQILATGMSAGGDSGSVGITKDGYVFGLLFAGSPSHATIFNDINNVVDQLNIKFKQYPDPEPEPEPEKTTTILLIIAAIILFYLLTL